VWKFACNEGERSMNSVVPLRSVGVVVAGSETGTEPTVFALNRMSFAVGNSVWVCGIKDR
jgi:hypothetical protein